MSNMTGDLSRRRLILGTAGFVGTLGFFNANATAQNSPSNGGPILESLHGAVAANREYALPPLPYAANALEPSIDAETMTVHHDKHHAAYVKGANDALTKLSEIREGKVDVGAVSEWSEKLAFNLSGHVLHSIFWPGMGPSAGGKPTGSIAADINRDFGTLEAFRGQFSAAAAQVQGNGWAVLAWEPLARRLLVLQVRNHQLNVAWGAVPMLVLDVWEHAYYLKYRNVRADYVKAFWDVINWTAVEKWYAFVKQLHRAE